MVNRILGCTNPFVVASLLAVDDIFRETSLCLEGSAPVPDPFRTHL